MSKPGRAICGWKAFLDKIDGLKDSGSGKWVFRGEPKADTPLKSSLESLAVDRWGCDGAELSDIEEGLLRQFRRAAHQYIDHLPDKDDFMGWTSIMRHHGAPTRLLDWTYSPYVALYFALSDAEPETHCSVWAVNTDWLLERTSSDTGLLPADAKKRLKSDPNAKNPTTVNSIIKRDPAVALVYPLNPFSLNQRLILQQGVFLVPGDVSRSFMDNLDALGDRNGHVVELRVCCTREFMREAVGELRHMNISSAVLFPGIDGFAKGLASAIPFPDQRPTD